VSINVEAIREFYRRRGYHSVYGIPLPETLEQLGLGWAAGDAEKALREAEKRTAAAKKPRAQRTEKIRGCASKRPNASRVPSPSRTWAT